MMSERARSLIYYKGEKMWSSGGGPITIGPRILPERIKNELKIATDFNGIEQKSEWEPSLIKTAPTKIAHPVFE